MLLLRKGFPEEDELVLCTITAVQYHSVFAKLDEFEHKSGMIHISEVSPGRIRNIRDYVVEGKKVVCKVLRINLEKGHIDLSLRRVNESQKRLKLNEIKQEQLCEKIIEFVAKPLKLKTEDLFKQVHTAISKKYDSLFSAFEAVVAEKLDLADLLDKKLSEPLTVTIKQRIKPPRVIIEGDFMLSTFAHDGVVLIKEALLKAKEIKGEISLKSAGGGKYHIAVVDEEYKPAEKTLKQVVTAVSDFCKKKKIDFEFIRKGKE